MPDPSVTRHADAVLRVALGTPGQLELSDAIGGSWRRCVNDYALDPVRAYEPAVVTSTALKDRVVQHEHLIQIASAEMDVLYDQIAGSGYALLLTDATGIILCERVDPTLKKMFGSAGLVLGADWSEVHEGTNGIGTCIREDRPVIVHRAEHFRARHTGLSCSGAPIHDSTGSLLAVLDASTVDARDTRTSQMHTMALVNLSARLIEKCVFLRHHQNAVIVRFHSRPELVNLLHDGSLALGPGGNVIAADETAVRLLGARGRGDLVGHTLEEIFDTSVRDLLSPASSARQALWPVRDLALGRRYFASVHFSGGAGGLGGGASSGSDSAQATMRAPVLGGPAPAANRASKLGSQAPSTARAPTVGSPAAPSVRPAIRVAPEHRNLTLADIAGDDPQLKRTVRRAARVSSSGLPILIQGPTGTGKECLARALHDAGDRASRPFVALNCAAFPETLIESELFGYGGGAFTGARKEGRKGKILQASGGTLFLDEIGDMPLTLQTRLLRVLEEQEVTPLGTEQVLSVDLRIMCASHRRLRDMVAQGTFREDLYYRLNGMTFELPALADRADKHALIRRLLARQTNGAGKSIDPTALQRLTAYRWPGNIRELSNAIRGALAICEGGVIRAGDLPPEIEGIDSATADGTSALGADAKGTAVVPANGLRRAERDAVLDAIKANDGNMAGAARTLRISRNTLYRKLRIHGIVVSRIEGLSFRRQ